MRNILVLILCVFLAGCAVGNTADYHRGKYNSFDEKFSGDSKLFVLVSDLRPYVVSGDKTSSFAGLQRSFYGIPYPVHTKSGKSLADDLSGLIARSIEENVSDVKNKSLTDNDSATMVVKANTQGDWKTLLFTLREWKTDISGVGTGAFHYDVTLAILDSSGSQLAKKSTKGKGLVNANHTPSMNIGEVLDQLLNDPNIVLAVNGRNASPAKAIVESKPSPVIVESKHSHGIVETKPSREIVESKPVVTSPSSEAKQDCTVDQILGMKNMGMTEAQIKAACN